MDQYSIFNCFLNNIKIGNKLFDNYELEFYQGWINDLDKLKYKWPKLIKPSLTSSKNASNKIIYLSVEQEHSSNSNENEKSSRVLSKKLNRLNSIKSECKLKLNEVNPCLVNNTLLITMASGIDDLKYIDYKVNVYFPYIIVCIPFKAGLVNDTSKTEYFFTLIDESDFVECVKIARQIGFKQRSFIVAENIRKFLFWDKIEITKSLLKPNSYTNGIFFIRDTVANGYGQINILQSNMTLCKVYEASEENNICSNIIDAINKLNWHSNDLVSEQCSNMEMKTIWLPDLHDGTRVDPSSTLIHLGKLK